MARKKKIVLHIGPNPSELAQAHDALAAEAPLLETVGYAVAGATGDQLDAAAHEMLRSHKSAGLKRKDVEGSWAAACRRIAKAKVDAVVSQPRFCTADGAQIALIVDALAGLDVHVVATPEEGEEPDELVARWSKHLKPGRTHVAPLSADAAAVDLAEELVGIALCLQQRDLDAKITKLKQRRKLVRHRLALREAS
ncbi:hypothetical protein [Nocardioides sp. Root140]|uniref:hypothetical protein n=1 Tax=Nocardioides sp. Root140 TaxID=1736460 RepID=UPI0006F542F6|nr:hypothetical protein [Nocardioides sp. Root140]KQY57138.1 hypothetical protein ASD30_12880 [Nocardioides sp. Root140]